MENKEFIADITHAHVTCQTYMMMLTYVSNGLHTDVVKVLARSLNELTDNRHWENFDLDALKAAPDDFLRELGFEIQEQAEKFEELMHEITEDSLSSQTAELWMLMFSMYIEFSHRPKSFLSSAVNVVIGNHELFPKEFFSFFVSKLTEYEMESEINRLGDGLGFTVVMLPPDVLQQIEISFQQQKFEQKTNAQKNARKKGGKDKKELLN